MMWVSVCDIAFVLEEVQAADATAYHDIAGLLVDASDELGMLEGQAILWCISERHRPYCERAIGIPTKAEANAVRAGCLVSKRVSEDRFTKPESHGMRKWSF